MQQAVRRVIDCLDIRRVHGTFDSNVFQVTKCWMAPSRTDACGRDLCGQRPPRRPGACVSPFRLAPLSLFTGTRFFFSGQGTGSRARMHVSHFSPCTARPLLAVPLRVHFTLDAEHGPPTLDKGERGASLGQ